MPNKQLYDFKSFLSVYPNKLIRYSKNVNPDTRDYTQHWINKGAIISADGTLVKPTVKSIVSDNNTNGLLSSRGSNRMNLAIDWILLLSKEKTSLNHSLKTFYKWKLNFVTLTLASKQVHSDNYIKKMLLNQFFIEVKKKYLIKNYVWRAESQSNGNIHFHIIFDKFIPWQELRDMWNRIQNKLGYVDKFKEKFNHSNPNGTDVHSLKNIKNIGAYLSKYCSKNAKGITILSSLSFFGFSKFPLMLSYKHNYPAHKTKFYRQIKGKLWGLSTELSKLKKCSMLIENSIIEKKIFGLRASHPRLFFDKDYCTIIKIGIKDLISFGLIEVRDIVASFVRSIIYPSVQLKIAPI